MSRLTTTRRGFLEKITSAGAAAGALATLESARGFAANDTLNVACLGTGGRCQTLMKSLAQVPGVKIAAICDIYDAHLHGAAGLADSRAFATKHYREILDRKDIDAVLIASLDHWHVPMAIDACNAGKDVYVEKPLTHDLAEGAAIIEAQNRNKKIVQCGMQQRSMPHIQKGREMVKSGRIGEVFKVHLTWNRGGETRFQRGPMGVDPRQVAWKDFIQCLLEYPNHVQAHFEGTFSNANLGAMITFMGTEGTLYIDRGRHELSPDLGKGKPESWILGSNPKKGADFYDKPDGEPLHLTNWVECIRGRQRPSAPVRGWRECGLGRPPGQPRFSIRTGRDVGVGVRTGRLNTRCAVQ